MICPSCDHEVRDLSFSWPFSEDFLFTDTMDLHEGYYTHVCWECYEALEAEQLLRDTGFYQDLNRDPQAPKLDLQQEIWAKAYVGTDFANGLSDTAVFALYQSGVLTLKELGSRMLTKAE